MPDLTEWMSVLARASQLAQAGGLSEQELSVALERLVSAASSLASATQDSSPLVQQRLWDGIRKNLDDDPMLILWTLRLAARLSETSWNKFFSNFVIRAVAERRQILTQKGKELGHSPPVTLVVNPTMACNLRCRGCYSFEYQRDSMPPELFRKVLTEARQMGIRFITLTGGEPFVYPQLFSIVKEFSDLTFMAYTNGTLIDDACADKLAEVGNLFPGFSVEGYEKETEDRRGPGVYSQVLSAMSRLRKRGVLFGISATPTRINSDVICSDDFIDFYLAQGASFVWLFTYIPVGRSPELDLMTTPEQRDTLRQATVRWRKTKPIFLGDFWNDGATCGGCLSASRYAFVAPNGNVQPCTFVHFYTHNIKDHTLQEIFESPFFKAIRQAQPYDRNLLRPCKIIDHPQILRQLVSQCGAIPSYPGAEAILDDPAFRAHLDQYSRDYSKLAACAWKGPDYQDGHRALVPFSGLVDLYERFPDRMAAAERISAQSKAQPSCPCAPQPIRKQ